MRMMMSTTSHTTMGSSYSIAPEAATVQPKSPWHSPVPYLFGGLAAMLGLIAFALLILACSYWKLSRDDTQQQGNDDLESGGDHKGDGISKMNGVPVFEEKIVVIMAGNDKPTFLATPALMLSSSKNGDSNDDDDDHAMVGSTIAKHDDEANKESSSVVDDDDDHHKEDESTHQPHD